MLDEIIDALTAEHQAKLLAAEGAGVMTVARSGTGLPGRLHIHADLDDSQAPHTIIERVRAGGASPDILVLNAGGPPMGGGRVGQLLL